MNRVLFLIISFLVSMSVVAQFNETDYGRESNTAAPLSRLKTSMTVVRSNSDTICVNFEKRKDICEFFTGMFFKRMDNTVLKLPSTRMKDRFLSCGNHPIVDYSVKMLSGGRVYLKELRLVVPPKEEKVVLTTTDSNGETLSEIELILSPKMTFYVKINNNKCLLDASLLERPSFEETDEISFEAVTINGKKMVVEKHLLIDYSVMGYLPFEVGPYLSLIEKRQLLARPNGKFGFRIVYGDGKNNSWEVYIPF